MANLQQIVEDLSALTVLEASELSKMLEEKWGVSAAAPVAMAAVAGAAAAGRGGRGADRVQRHPGRDRREEDQRDQGGARDHRARPEGGQGPGRGRAQAGQGRGLQGRGGQAQGAARRGGCHGGGQVALDRAAGLRLGVAGGAAAPRDVAAARGRPRAQLDHPAGTGTGSIPGGMNLLALRAHRRTAAARRSQRPSSVGHYASDADQP